MHELARVWKRRLNLAIDVITGLCFTVMFLDITLQIVARNFLRLPFSWTEELARFLYVWIVFLGAVSITADDEHIRIEIVSQALPVKAQKVLAAVGNLLAIVFCLVSVHGGFRLASMNITFTFPSLPHFFKLGMMYAVVPIGMALISILLALKTLFIIRELFAGTAAGPTVDVHGGKNDV